MKFYGVDIQGIFQIQSIATLPVWTGSDERRWIYTADTNQCYYGTNESWMEFGITNLFTSLPGFLIRPKFTRKDVDELYIGPGVYHHSGTVEQFVYWDSQLTVQLSGGSGDTWYYVYLDDTAIVSAGTNLLTASEFIFSSSAPTYSHAKHGWYNGNDRCIFSVRTVSGSDDILEFFHGSNLVMFADQITDLSPTVTANVWEDVTLTIPAFTTQAEVRIFGAYVDGSSWAQWITKDQDSSGEHNVFFIDNSPYGEQGDNTLSVITNDSQIIQVKTSVVNNNTIGVATQGWYFPTGM